MSDGDAGSERQRVRGEGRRRFDLADGLLVVGVVMMLVAIYWIGGGAWLLLAAGVLAAAAALRLSDDF